jgi:hypothetical protein
VTGADPDWTAPPVNTAINNIGVVLRDNWSSNYFYSGPIGMFEHDYTLSAPDHGKVLDSISYSITSANYEMLFAVSGDAVPEPSSITLGILSLVYIGRREVNNPDHHRGATSQDLAIDAAFALPSRRRST